LERIITDQSASADRRLGALWALEGLLDCGGKRSATPLSNAIASSEARALSSLRSTGALQNAAASPCIPTTLLVVLASDPNPNLRHEAARIAAAQPRPEAEFVSIAAPLVGDARPSVRAAVGDALRRVPNASPRVMVLAASLGRESLTSGGEWDKYEREFERYLARWAMELNPQSTVAMLNSPAGQALPLENRVLATLALGGKESAIGLAKLVPELRRPLGDEEVRTLAAHFGETAVSEALGSALTNENSRAAVLHALLNLRTSLDTARLTPALTAAAKTLLAGDNVADVALGTEVKLLWGEADGGSKKPTVERHRQIEIRAKVSPAPYAKQAQTTYHEGWRTKATA
jgi:hypothetical protein